MEGTVAKVAMLALAALLSGSAHSPRLENNIVTGALIGGGAGVAIGGLTRGTIGGAFSGEVTGALADGLVGAAVTPPPRCYVHTASGAWRKAWCRG
jgi:hypothetical protein